MHISGHTKPYAVLGHPIGHTLSPVMHNAAFRELGWDALYLAFDVEPDRLLPVLESMGDMGFGGVNLTVPLKEVAFSGLAKLDESAQLLGAVNTVQFGAGGLVGHNTDGDGFLKAVEEAFGAGVEGRRLFVLGTGGAGRAVALASAKAAAIVLADIDATRSQKVAEEIRSLRPHADVSVVSDAGAQVTAARDADLIVQATPVGMKSGEPSLLGSDAFRNGQCVFDLIYMYPETAFMKTAREAGASVANGLGMLLHQGARAFEIWTGTPPPTGVMREALEKAVYA